MPCAVHPALGLSQLLRQAGHSALTSATCAVSQTLILPMSQAPPRASAAASQHRPQDAVVEPAVGHQPTAAMGTRSDPHSPQQVPLTPEHQSQTWASQLSLEPLNPNSPSLGRQSSVALLTCPSSHSQALPATIYTSLKSRSAFVPCTSQASAAVSSKNQSLSTSS